MHCKEPVQYPRTPGGKGACRPCRCKCMPGCCHLNWGQACCQNHGPLGCGPLGCGVACGCSAGSCLHLTPAASSRAAAAEPPARLCPHAPCKKCNVSNIPLGKLDQSSYNSSSSRTILELPGPGPGPEMQLGHLFLTRVQMFCKDCSPQSHKKGDSGCNHPLDLCHLEIRCLWNSILCAPCAWLCAPCSLESSVSEYMTLTLDS